VTPNAGSTSARIVLQDDGGVADYQGDGVSGAFFWGYQVEAGAFPTSYIPTTTAQVTRSADAASMTGANFSSWFNNSEGSIYSEVAVRIPQSITIYPYNFISSSGQADYIPLRITASNGVANARVASGGSVVSDLSMGTFANNVFRKTAQAYKFNDYAASSNGGAAVTNNSAIVPLNLSRFFIGSFDSTNNVGCNGHIRKIAYYPSRLANAELQALTQN
jgi:hypothetical protein